MSNTVRNARIQLLATALNNMGVGSIIAGIVAPTVSGTVGDPAHIAAWMVFGVNLIGMAQLLLGRLRG